MSTSTLRLWHSGRVTRLRTAFPLLVLPLMLSVPRADARARQEPPDSWLNQQPPRSWNTPGSAVPAAPISQDEDRVQLLARCKLSVHTRTPAESALAGAGWIPFRVFERELVRGDVEVMGGMAGADGMCRPAQFNVFVFVGGRFAGTLSPAPMISRFDGSIGAVRLPEDDLIAAEYARYSPSDPLCCPSSRVTARFRIDRAGAQPVVTPLDVRRTR